MTDRPDPAKPAGGPTSGTIPASGADAPTGSTPGPTQGGSSSTGSTDSLSETARRTASDAAAAARGMAADQTDRAREAVADEVSGVAHALRTAADDLREGSAQERTFAQIADTLADAAEAIRDKDLGEMMHEATRMARRHPMTFLGGAALLGFTAVRFARASRDGGERVTARRGAGYGAAEHRPGPTTSPTRPASPEVARARRMP
jgi:hypothetical protein